MDIKNLLKNIDSSFSIDEEAEKFIEHFVRECNVLSQQLKPIDIASSILTSAVECMKKIEKSMNKLLPETANWLIPNKVIMGGYPDPAKGYPKMLVDLGVRTFISLQEEEEMKNFRNYKKQAIEADSGVLFENFEIKDRGIADDSNVDSFVDELIILIKDRPGIIYIHCFGGNGRAGTIAAILYSRYYKVSAETSIKKVRELHSYRKIYTSGERKHGGQINTAIQEKQVYRLAYKDDKPIDFYDEIPNPYIVFSNFYYPKNLNIIRKNWPTIEHFFHALKFTGNRDTKEQKEYREIIRHASTPYKSKILGNQRINNPFMSNLSLNDSDKRTLKQLVDEYKNKVSMVKNWDSIKDDIMYRGVKEKFEQNSDLKALLLSTKGHVIREASPRDGYWGTDKDGSGKNMLGNILMNVRDEMLGIFQSVDYYEKLTKKYSDIPPEKGSGKQLTKGQAEKLFKSYQYLDTGDDLDTSNQIKSTCIILGIANNKELAELSKKIGVRIPKKIESSETTEELIKRVKNIYPDAEFLDRNDLLLLNADNAKDESEDNAKDESEDNAKRKSDIIKFYEEKIPARAKKGYYFNDIVYRWDDYRLEEEHDFIQALFPDKSGGVVGSPNLTDNDVNVFKKDAKIRIKVAHAVRRMLNFYGLELQTDFSTKIIKPLNRRDRGSAIGLYSDHNYRRITRIMKFLNVIDATEVSALFFLSICTAMKSDKILTQKIIDFGAIKKWMKTQTFLLPYISKYDTGSLLDVKEAKEINCRFTGMKYTGNSCYMDSALMCLFAIPNHTIDMYMLQQNLDNLKGRINLWLSCNKDIDKDIKVRKNIQLELRKIAYAERNPGKGDVSNVKNLRLTFKKCPGSEEFHSTRTQDSGEFLTYLFNIFQIDVATLTNKYYGSNDNKNWTFVEKHKSKDSPIIDVPPYLLHNAKEGVDLSVFLKKKDSGPLTDWNEGYTYRKHVRKMKKSPIIIFNIQRSSQEYDAKTKRIKPSVSWKKVSAPEKITLRKNELILTGIVVHTGGAHYVASVKCNGEWYFYNDMDSSIKKLGSYDSMLKNKPDPLGHGTLFFYT